MTLVYIRKILGRFVLLVQISRVGGLISLIDDALMNLFFLKGIARQLHYRSIIKYNSQIFQNGFIMLKMIIKPLLIAYGIFILAILHATLLFCAGDHCIISFERPPVPQQVAYNLRVGISALLPLQLKTLQVIAQWIVIGEIMLIFIWIIKRLQEIICCMIWILLAFVAAMALLAFFSHTNLSQVITQTVVSSDLVSQQQLNGFMKTVNQTMHSFKDFLK